MPCNADPRLPQPLNAAQIFSRFTLATLRPPTLLLHPVVGVAVARETAREVEREIAREAAQEAP